MTPCEAPSFLLQANLKCCLVTSRGQHELKVQSPKRNSVTQVLPNVRCNALCVTEHMHRYSVCLICLLRCWWLVFMGVCDDRILHVLLLWFSTVSSGLVAPRSHALFVKSVTPFLLLPKHSSVFHICILQKWVFISSSCVLQPHICCLSSTNSLLSLIFHMQTLPAKSFNKCSGCYDDYECSTQYYIKKLFQHCTSLGLMQW